MKAFATALAAAAAISGGTAWASTNPPPPPKTMNLGALTAPSPPPPATPERLALARQLMIAMGFQDQIKAVFAGMNGRISKLFDTTGTLEQQHLLQLVQAQVQDQLLTLPPQMEAAVAKVYADNLTDKEIADDIAFQTSDSGRSIRRKTPAMTRAITVALAPLITQMTGTVVQKTVAQVCEENHCTPEQRQHLEAVATGRTAMGGVGVASGPRLVGGDPYWIQQPTGDQLALFYPDRAQRMEKEGDASIHCKVTTEGLLTDCRVASENPPGFGFGDATIKISRFFQMKPAMRDGRPVEGEVTVPVRWRLGHTAPPIPLPPASPPPSGIRVVPPSPHP